MLAVLPAPRLTVAPSLLAEISRAVARLTTLEEVVRWSFSRTPARNVDEVIVQDEYTHDVVLEWAAPVYLVFDTT